MAKTERKSKMTEGKNEFTEADCENRWRPLPARRRREEHEDLQAGEPHPCCTVNASHPGGGSSRGCRQVRRADVLTKDTEKDLDEHLTHILTFSSSDAYLPLLEQA